MPAMLWWRAVPHEHRLGVTAERQRCGMGGQRRPLTLVICQELLSLFIYAAPRPSRIFSVAVLSSPSLLAILLL